ncbi:MAG: mismatch repair protein MutT [Candidatus Saccharibacteria bacterium]|nr:mismatch repair protein MutT [Candidatus Saccharibacteria bacterium]
MRTSARVIVTKDNKLLIMKRSKFGDKFYALVGGGVDPGETPEQALYREVAEEACITITNHRLVIVEDAGPMYGLQYIYLADYVSGEPALAADSEEAHSNAGGQNLYEPMWIPIKDLAEADVRPKELKQLLIRGLAGDFPDEPIELTIPA